MSRQVISVGILFLSILASATSSKYEQDTLHVSQVSPGQQNGSVKTKYVMNACKATLEGFEQGLYDDFTFKLSPQCLGDKTLQDVLQLEDIVRNKTGFKGFIPAVQSIISIGQNVLKSCELYKLYYNILSYFSKSSPTWKEIYNNLKMNIFKLTGIANDIFRVIFKSDKVTDLLDLTNAYVFF